MSNVRNIKSLLLDIKNSFEFNNDNWKDKAIDFIASGLEIIGCTPTFEKVSESFTVEDYRLPLPVYADNIIEIEGDCCEEIPIMNTTTLFSDCKCCTITSDTKYAEMNPGWLHFNFETGTIKLHYFTLPLDDDGLPLIPSDVLVFQALGWWVVYKLMLSGNKHHTLTSWKEAYQMWTNLYPQAQNRLKMPSPAEMRLMGNMWVNPTIRGSLYLAL